MSTVKIYAQEIREIIPFKHENKWGIVNNNNVELVKPTYNEVNIFNDFMYAEFDQKDLYNLQTGEKFTVFGEYCSSVKIEKEMYYLFTNSEKSALINFENKDTIQLSLKYKWMKTTPLFDEKGVESNTVTIGCLEDGKILFLKNNKALSTLVSKRFNTEEIEFISYKDKRIGFVVKKDGYFLFYDHNLKIARKIVADKEVRYYELLTDNARKEIPNIYIEGATTDGFNSEEVWDDSWEIEGQELQTISENKNELDFYIAHNGRYDYVLKNTGKEDFNLEVRLRVIDYVKVYKTVQIRDTESLFFYDSRYIETPNILFPRIYLTGKKNPLEQK